MGVLVGHESLSQHAYQWPFRHRPYGSPRARPRGPSGRSTLVSGVVDGTAVRILSFYSCVWERLDRRSICRSHAYPERMSPIRGLGPSVGPSHLARRRLGPNGSSAEALPIRGSSLRGESGNWARASWEEAKNAYRASKELHGYEL
jgi:hypothetical protein